MLQILVNKLLILKYGPLLSWTPCISFVDWHPSVSHTNLVGATLTTQCASTIKTNLFMLFSALISVHCTYHSKHRMCGTTQNSVMLQQLASGYCWASTANRTENFRTE